MEGSDMQFEKDHSTVLWRRNGLLTAVSMKGTGGNQETKIACMRVAKEMRARWSIPTDNIKTRWTTTYGGRGEEKCEWQVGFLSYTNIHGKGE